MAQGAADAKLHAQQTTQQVQQSAQQFQQNATQQGQQAWQYAQGQANQAVTNTTHAAQQTAQTAQQSTQAAADAAKEIINRYAQPMSPATAPPAAAPPAAAPPAVAPPSGNAPWQVPAAAAVAAANALPFGAPAQTLPPANPPQAAPAESNPALAPSMTVMAAGTYSIAMGGYCPVTLASEKKWKKGQPQFAVIHRRRTFLFASEIEQKKFLLEPDRYSPVMSGYDPVRFMQTGELVDGSPAYSLTYRKQVYLFTSDAALKTFWQNPIQFNEGLRQAMSQQERGTQLR
jgi:YHS domain-containing protein